MLNSWWLDLVTNEQWAYIDDLFTADEIKKIKETGEDTVLSDPAEAKVGDGKTLNKDIRAGKISWIKSDAPENAWIFHKIVQAVNKINADYYQFDLTYIEALQFTTYPSDTGGHYGRHIDMTYKSIGTRKMSFTIQLTDESEYEGGELVLLTGEEQVMSKKFGRIIFFPSYLLHEVKPVTKGTRQSLVGWVHGPKFK